MRGEAEHEMRALTRQAQRCMMEGHVWGAITALERIGTDGDAADYEAVLALGPQLQAGASNPEQEAACEALMSRAQARLLALAKANSTHGRTPQPALVAQGAATANGSVAMVPQPLVTDTNLCPRCAEEVKAAAVACRFCGFRFGQRAFEAQSGWHEPPSTSWVAVVAFLASLTSLWMAAIPLAIHARRTIDRSDGRLVGRGFATAGLTLGILGLIFWLLFAAAVVVFLTYRPNLG